MKLAIDRRQTLMYIPRINVILFGMVGFIKDKQVDLLHSDMTVHQAMIQDISRTDDHHVILEMLCPSLLAPKVDPHCTEEVSNFLV